jgi:heptosyltransferase-1
VIDWVVEKTYEELISNNPSINEVHTVNFKLAKQKKSLPIFFKEIKKIRQFGKFDIVIDMQGLIKSAFVSRIIPSNVTVGFDSSSSRESISSIFYSHKYKIDYKENIILRNLSLVANSLDFIFKENELKTKDPFLYPSKKYIATGFSKNMKNIILIPGASYPCKCYPEEKYAKVVKKINANFLIIWGNDREKLIAEKIKKLNPSVNISKKLSLDELISLIKQSDLIIGSDTGPSHISWGLNVPSIILFGCTPGNRNAYKTKQNKIIDSDTIVNPLKINKNDYSISKIDSNEIVKIATLILSNSE